MEKISDATVFGGKVELSNLPFADGQRVRVTVSDQTQSTSDRSIQEVRELLRGNVELFEAPFEPMIPTEHWGMLK